MLFKINTVVNTYNFEENMVEEITKLAPVRWVQNLIFPESCIENILHYRWKVFQCLLLEGENAGPDALRNAEMFYIENEVFQNFLDTHKSVSCLVPESNTKMQNSYLILDEYVNINFYLSIPLLTESFRWDFWIVVGVLKFHQNRFWMLGFLMRWTFQGSTKPCSRNVVVFTNGQNMPIVWHGKFNMYFLYRYESYLLVSIFNECDKRLILCLNFIFNMIMQVL